MEDIITQRKINVGSIPNTRINTLNKEKKNITKSCFKKFIIQLFFCIILIATLAIYKKVNLTSYQYNINKYKWILQYNTTYNDVYNNVAVYINQKFKFNIPLKEEKSEIIIEESIDNVEGNVQNVEENSNLEVVEVSNSYDSMRIMAEELRSKYTFQIPTNGTISCEFGNRNPSDKSISTFHLGLDIANSIGTEIKSAMEGVVSEISYNGTYGNYVKIVKDDVLIVYAHCSKILVNNGENISVGQNIALMGETGIATGPHLHFEVRKNGLVINPEYIINFR